MLIVALRPHEMLLIGDVRVMLPSTCKKSIRLAIDAPRHLKVDRRPRPLHEDDASGKVKHGTKHVR